MVERGEPSFNWMIGARPPSFNQMVDDTPSPVQLDG
jgi:hypothetical protein